jgi:hypothetical protein
MKTKARATNAASFAIDALLLFYNIALLPVDDESVFITNVTQGLCDFSNSFQRFFHDKVDQVVPLHSWLVENTCAVGIGNSIDYDRGTAGG